MTVHARFSGLLRASLCCICGLLFSVSSLAVELEIKQKNGEPAAGVVVTLSNDSAQNSKATAVEMVQRDRQFEPHILVVQKGTTVSFPNYDDIKHHVYSFSSVKSFEKELYKGRESTSETFNEPGVVELGCNVHDWMLGYIYIADTPFFGTTNEQGRLSLPAVPDGDYQLTIWHPRLSNEDSTQVVNARISGVFRIALTDAIEAEESSEFDFDFDDY